jgi:hypothetical protein
MMVDKKSIGGPLEVGDVLKGEWGTTILAVKPDWTKKYQIVLALIHKRSGPEFVTWFYSPESSFVQGHYTKDLEDALDDFKKRS